MFAIILNGENINLAKQEVLSLCLSKDFTLTDKLMIINGKIDYKRISFSHKVLKVLYNIKSISNINELSINRFYKDSFSVRILRYPQKLSIYTNESEIGSIVWRRLRNPHVNLVDPKTKFVVIFTKDNIYFCKEMFVVDKKAMLRRDAKFRPGFHPTSMNARFAKTLVNLSTAKKGDILLDPFCGVGGILIEAGKLGLRIIGYDISQEMVRKCIDNLNFYRIKNFKVLNRDALTANIKVDAIVTDLPYGRHSSLYGKNRKQLYESFINKSFYLLKKNKILVMVVPIKVRINPEKFSLINVINYRVHRTLTRKILVMRKN